MGNETVTSRKRHELIVAPGSARWRDAIILGGFFASGAAGLLYEICWIRKAALVFGAATPAVSTVLSAFFAGMAAGYYAFGRYAQRTRRPLRVYALLELTLGALGLLSPLCFVAAETLYASVYPQVAGSAAALILIRLVLVGAVLMPATFLMGGTLPLFCRAYVRLDSRLSLAVGGLYAWNTLGAAVGCAASGFLLIPAIGVNTTIYLAGTLNLIIGTAVLGIGRRLPLTDPLTATPPVQSTGSSAQRTSERRAIYVLFFLTGFALLGNEVVWIRFLSLLVRNTVYTYTVTVTLILAGIVLGSLLIALFADRIRHRALLFGLLQVVVGILVLVVLTRPPGWWRSSLDPTSVRNSLWAFAAVLLLPAVVSGASFPLAIRMAVEQAALAPGRVGRMSAVNTVGGIIGSLAVGFVLLPRWGLHVSLLVTTGAYLLIGFAAWILLERSIRPAYRLALVAGGTAAWLAPALLNTTRLPADFLARRDELVDFREGLSCDLAVVRKSGLLRLEIDQLWQGQTGRNHQIMAAHVPMLLHPDPNQVAVIGVGTGTTCSRFLMYDIDGLDSIDIEPALFDLIRRHFDSAWMDDPRVRLIAEDGRNYLACTDRSYDLISIDVGQIFRPGAAAFYTVDFYARARDRLRPGGLISQFVPLGSFTPEEFRTVVASFLEVFPQSILWHNISELLLIGTVGDDLMLRPASWALVEASPVLKSDLQYAHWGGPARALNRKEVFLAGFLAGPETLATLTGKAPRYRDDRPFLEYSTARYLERAERRIVDLLRQNLDPVGRIMPGAAEDDVVSAAATIRTRNLDDVVASSFLRTGIEKAEAGRWEEAIKDLRQAVQWNPENSEANRVLGGALLSRGQKEPAAEYYAAAVRIDPESATNQHHFARGLHVLGRLPEATEHYRASLRLNPLDAEVHNNLAGALAAQRDLDGARTHLEEALRLQPGFADALSNLAKVRAALARRAGEPPAVPATRPPAVPASRPPDPLPLPPC
ncbi:MAG: hypothetical protein AMXMBFR13_11990 [Phycisphaerae bacterium]